MYDVLKWSGQGTLCCWLRVHIRRLQVMGSVCSIGLVALLPRGGRSRKRDAGRGAEVKPRCEDARRASRDRDTRVSCNHGDRACFPRVTVPQATAQIGQIGSINRDRSAQREIGVSRMCRCVTRCRRGLPIKNLKGLRHTQTTWGRPGQRGTRRYRPVCPRELHISPLSPLYCCTLHGWQRGRRIATQHIPQGLHTPPRTWALSLLADGM
jgi:hypothetical protein